MGILPRLNRRRSKKRSRRLPLVRWIGPAIGVTAIGFALLMAVTGSIDLKVLDELRERLAADVPQEVNLEALGAKSPETIRVATFNVQQLGDTKLAESEIMGTLAQIVAQLDVVAFQEVQGDDDRAVPALLDLLRAQGADYDGTTSTSIGPEGLLERYAFVWDRSRVDLVPNSAYVVQDPADRMSREPMIASFQTRVADATVGRPFRFTLINVRSVVDEDPRVGVPREGAAANRGLASAPPVNEMDVLDDVFVRVREYDYQTSGEEDCIMLGDLSVDATNLRELGQIYGLESIAGNTPTNTAGTQTYDHILLDRRFTSEYTGRFGVIDMQRAFGLTKDEAMMISDHQPLWAEFRVFEAGPPQVAGQDGATAGIYR